MILCAHCECVRTRSIEGEFEKTVECVRVSTHVLNSLGTNFGPLPGDWEREVLLLVFRRSGFRIWLLSPGI